MRAKKMTKQVTRLDILKNDSLPEKEVTIPDWDGIVVTVQGMTGSQFEAWQESLASRGKGKNKINLKDASAELAIMSSYTRNEEGVLERLFLDTDASVLATKSARALNTITAVAMELNGMLQKELQELVGN